MKHSIMKKTLLLIRIQLQPLCVGTKSRSQTAADYEGTPDDIATQTETNKLIRYAD